MAKNKRGVTVQVKQLGEVMWLEIDVHAVWGPLVLHVEQLAEDEDGEPIDRIVQTCPVLGLVPGQPVRKLIRSTCTRATVELWEGEARSSKPGRGDRHFGPVEVDVEALMEAGGLMGLMSGEPVEREWKNAALSAELMRVVVAELPTVRGTLQQLARKQPGLQASAVPAGVWPRVRAAWGVLRGRPVPVGRSAVQRMAEQAMKARG